MVVRALEHVALVEAALLGVVDAVDRNGLADSTLVIFAADHGDAVGSNGGICNKGGLMVEETMRIPLLMRGPGVPPGTTCDRLISNLDLPRTIPPDVRYRRGIRSARTESRRADGLAAGRVAQGLHGRTQRTA